jgi:hypothetical protein
MHTEPDPFDETPLEMAIRLQNSLIGLSTGGSFDGADAEYKKLRRSFGERTDTKTKLPDFVRRCRDLGQFWGWIKQRCPTYAGRRELLRQEFHPLLDHLEANDRAPGVAPITETLEAFDPEHIHAAWQKALDRRVADPAGAITAARTLLETVCKHILDDVGTPYADDADLPKLWTAAAQELNLAPQQQQEHVFKTILGNCQSVVNNLAALRNRMGDAHGHGRGSVKPQPRHAKLAVNLAGTMAAFLVATLQERASHDTHC